MIKEPTPHFHQSPSSPTMSENTATADPMYRTKGEEYTPRASTTSTHDTRHDVVFQDIGHPIGEIGEPLSWTFSRFLQDARDRSEQQSEKHLALTWRDLTVKGVAASAAFGDDCWSYINPMETWRASRKQDGNQRV